MAAWTLPHKIAEWCENLTTALDRRSRKYFVTVVLGMVLATGRRTVSSWLRAAGVTNDWQDHYYFLQTVGHSARHLAAKLLHLAVRQIPFSHVGSFVKLALDDSPTKRYGPKVDAEHWSSALVVSNQTGPCCRTGGMVHRTAQNLVSETGDGDR